MKSNDQRNTPDVFEKSSANNSISATIFRYLPFWPVFLIAIIVSLTAGYFYIHYQTPIYEANATILLKDQSRGVDNSNVLDALNGGGSSKKVENEIEVLKSHILLQQVVKEMGLYTKLYSKGTFHDVLIYPAPVKFVSAHPNALQNTGNIPVSFKYLSTKGTLVLDGKEYPVDVPVVTPYGDFTIVVSKESLPLFATVKGEYYLQINDLKASVNNLLGALTIGSAALRIVFN